MDFDERVIQRAHVTAAVEKYLSSPMKHPPARSAFIVIGEQNLPAKFILRLAFEIATGFLPHPETLTGGKASIRVLKNLGFENAVFEKQSVVGGRRNTIKSARREALRQILSERWGVVEIEKKLDGVRVPDLTNRGGMDPTIQRVLERVEKARQRTISGRAGWVLAFDFFLPSVDLAIEFDERQHFTPLRAVALDAYPTGVSLGFDKERWIQLSEGIRAGDNNPAYRDEQRAFYDAIRDLMAPRIGLRPVVRIFEDDVRWEAEQSSPSKAASDVLKGIQELIDR